MTCTGLVYMCPESITQKYLEAFVPLYKSGRVRKQNPDAFV